MPKGRPAKKKEAKTVEPIVTTAGELSDPASINNPPTTRPTLTRVDYSRISDEAEGWLSPAEGDLLYLAAMNTAHKTSEEQQWAEVGSYAGKSTVILGGELALSHGGTLYAIDPHNGDVSEYTHATGGKLDTSQTHNLGPTEVKFAINVYEKAHLNQYVKMVKDACVNFVPPSKLSLVFIDGLHDLVSVQADYNHLKQYLADGATVIFHDYAWAGPYQVVNDAIARGELEMVHEVEMLVVLRYIGAK